MFYRSNPVASRSSATGLDGSLSIPKREESFSSRLSNAFNSSSLSDFSRSSSSLEKGFCTSFLTFSYCVFIKAGKSSNGIVYLTVYKGEAFHFDEVNCTAQYCLPVADVNLSAEGLPVKIKVKGYDGSTESVLKITDVSYAYEKEYPPQLKITFSGQKIDGNSSSYDIISYKLYDSNRYLIDSNNVYLDSLNTGDKFKDDSIVVYDITPGENYTLQFTEYN